MDGGRWTGHFRGLYVNMLVFSCQTEFLANFATAVLNVGRTVSSLSGSRVNELLGAGPVVLARRDEVSERDPGGPCLTGAKVCMDEGDDFDTIVPMANSALATGLTLSLAVMACGTSE